VLKCVIGCVSDHALMFDCVDDREQSNVRRSWWSYLLQNKNSSWKKFPGERVC